MTVFLGWSPRKDWFERAESSAGGGRPDYSWNISCYASSHLILTPLNILLLGLVLQLEAQEQTGGSFRLQM